MDGSRMQSLVNKGYRISAAKVGLPFNLFRPTGPADPVSPANLLTVLPAAFSADDYRFRRPQGYAKPLWTALVDGATTEPGDYLVEVAALPGQGIRTFFIAAQQQLVPIVAIECNDTLSVLRPTAGSGTGIRQPGGDQVKQEIPVLTGWPGSMLQGTKGEKPDDNLPNDARAAWMSILLPQTPGAEILPDDVVNDSNGHRYIVSSVELSPLGWRLTAAYADA